jgi:glutamate-1-semialdehyde 2,1-aminomutase
MMNDKLYMISRPLLDIEGNEITLKSGHGGMVTDIVGKEYVDFILGFGPVILGHDNREFLAEVAEKLSCGLCFPSYSVLQREYAEIINCRYSPAKALGFLPTSSESISAVLRMCNHLTGSKRFIRKGYIGWYDRLINRNIFWHEPINATDRRSTSTDLHYIGDGNQDAVNWVDNDIETFERLAADKDIACFIFDAYQTFRMPARVLEQAISICRDKGLLVIMDETKTGGRLGPCGSFIDTYDWDFTILGKAIGNGMPISVFIGKDNASSEYDGLKIGGTYSRQVAGTAAALATMDIMQKHGYYADLPIIGRKVAEIMNRSFSDYGLSEDIYADCHLDGCLLEFVYSDGLANDAAARKRLYDSFISGGIIIPYGHVFFICRAHEECLDAIALGMDRALKTFTFRN